MDYVIKTVRKHKGIPASEWLCHHVADACGISTPQFAIVQLSDGRLGFGSQWDSSSVSDHGTRQKILTEIPGVTGLAAKFSAIYVLDLFVHNDDQHEGNYFFVKTRGGHGVKAYDFSRAMLYHGWPMAALPLPRACNTMRCFSALRVGYPFDATAVRETIRRLRGVTPNQVRSWMQEMPDEWLSDHDRVRVYNWWADEADNRIKFIENGLANGTLL
jgi:hypothetical protein